MPNSVVRPPSRVPNAIGIRMRDGDTSVRRQISMTTGSIRAATPMLLMKNDSPPEVSITTITSVDSRVPAILMTWRPSSFAMPVRVMPSLRMNIAQTVMTAALPNPEMA